MRKNIVVNMHADIDFVRNIAYNIIVGVVDLFGSQIKRLRSERTLTQAQLAKAIGLEGKESTLRMWELEKSQPGIDKLIALADYFEVPIDVLFGRKSEEQRVEISNFEKNLSEVKLRLEYLDLIEQIQQNIMDVYRLSPEETTDRINEMKQVIGVLNELPIYEIPSDGRVTIYAKAEIMLAEKEAENQIEFITRVHHSSLKQFNKKLSEATQNIFNRCSDRFIEVFSKEILHERIDE
jgi:transcriptional regulator with XRE-family HTH domain